MALLLGLAEAAVLACALMVAYPASAQVLDERFPFLEDRARRNRQQWPQQPNSPFGAFPSDQPQQPRQHVQTDPSRPPPPRRPDIVPTTNVMVFGDSLADWLAYGLEEAFAETPEIGIARKSRAMTGLIRIETRTESYDWPQQVREMLTADKPDYVVMMIGTADRRGIRERLPARPATPQRQAGPQQPAAQPQPAQTPPAAAAAPKPADAEAPPDVAQAEDPSIIAPEAPSAGTVVHEFRTEKWAELYSRRIDETIAALKSRGVPVFWVGLPSIRGTRATSEMVYLNDLYRARAEKAGVIYIDVWDGFVDEAGNFNQFGADFEGQTRRLRSGDGVHFTRPGARKLAHYAEREIRRVMASRGTPTATPLPQEPEPEVKTPTLAAKPLASPVMSLTAPAQKNDTLLGAGPALGGTPDSIVTRVLVRGEPLDAPAGRADDFAWPRRDVVTASGVLAPDPLPLPPPTVAVPVTVPRPVAVAPRAPRERAAPPDGTWRPFAQQRPVDPREQRSRWNTWDNTPSFFGGWFGR